MILPSRPSIASLRSWKRTRLLIRLEMDSKNQSRFPFGPMHPRKETALRTLVVPCCKCGEPMHPCRGRKGNLSLHVSAEGHASCAHSDAAKSQILWLQLDLGKAVDAKRTRGAKEALRQDTLFSVDGPFTKKELKERGL